MYARAVCARLMLLLWSVWPEESGAPKHPDQVYGSAQQNPHGCSNCTDATRTADVLPGRIAGKQSTDVEISLQSPQGRLLASSEKKKHFIQNTPTAKAGQQCCGNPSPQNKLKMQAESGQENHGITTADLPPLSGTSKAARRKASSSGRSQLKMLVMSQKWYNKAPHMQSAILSNSHILPAAHGILTRTAMLKRQRVKTG